MIDALAVTTDEARQGIDARQLHAALHVGRDFSNWFKDQVDRFGFVEGQDFSPLSAKSTGGRPALEYTLSLTAAEMVALGQNNDAARAARAALLKIKDAWNSPTAVMARAVIMAHAENQRLRTEHGHAIALLAELTPKAAALDRLSAASGDVNLQDAGRVLGRQPNRFVAQLLEDGLLFRGAHGKPEPYAQWRDAGYFRVRISEVRGDAYLQTLVTPKGLAWLAGRYPQAPAVAVETSH